MNIQQSQKYYVCKKGPDVNFRIFIRRVGDTIRLTQYAKPRPPAMCLQHPCVYRGTKQLYTDV